jgi:hypothetical protein
MHAVAAAGAAFLIAVLWFDLMFDVQVRGRAGDELPPDVLASIAAYYRRVTTDASPMGRLITAVMLVTVAALIAELVQGRNPAWVGGLSLVLAVSAIGLAAARTVRNAVALGGGTGSAPERSALARSVFRDHIYCIIAMATVTAVQLAAR